MAQSTAMVWLRRHLLIVVLAILMALALFGGWILWQLVRVDHFSGVVKSTSALPGFTSVLGSLKTDGLVGFAGLRSARASNIAFCARVEREDLDAFVARLGLTEASNDAEFYRLMWDHDKKVPVEARLEIPEDANFICYRGAVDGWLFVAIVYDADTSVLLADAHAPVF
ncbi:MAG: hypothetical protein JXL80_17490 [Planctomycetes bacterium]|nr:hypothetical protein [Planctomycetota bacterium]